MSSENLKIVEIVVFVTAIAFLTYSLFMQSAGRSASTAYSYS